MDSYENLAQAIVLTAAKDYCTALKRLSRRPKDKVGLQTKDECERFFRSRWFGVLTGLDPEVLMSKLQMEVKK